MNSSSIWAMPFSRAMAIISSKKIVPMPKRQYFFRRAMATLARWHTLALLPKESWQLPAISPSTSHTIITFLGEALIPSRNAASCSMVSVHSSGSRRMKCVSLATSRRYSSISAASSGLGLRSVAFWPFLSVTFFSANSMGACPPSYSLLRWIVPEMVLGSCSRNSTMRGYL